MVTGRSVERERLGQPLFVVDRESGFSGGVFALSGALGICRQRGG